MLWSIDMCRNRPANVAQADHLGRCESGALIQIETTDARDRKALELAATAATWETLDGAFLVPSSDGKRTYVTTADTCSCEDNARGNRCKHRRAAAIYVALREASQPTPVDRRLCQEIGGGMRCNGFRDHPGPHCFTVESKAVEAPSRFTTMSEAELFARL